MIRFLPWRLYQLGLIVLAANLTCCSNVQIIPGDQEDTTQECIQMSEKLTNDKTLTSAQATEIRKNMEKAGCARRFSSEHDSLSYNSKVRDHPVVE
jgi:hypothetical protein